MAGQFAASTDTTSFDITRDVLTHFCDSAPIKYLIDAQGPLTIKMLEKTPGVKRWREDDTVGRGSRNTVQASDRRKDGDGDRPSARVADIDSNTAIGIRFAEPRSYKDAKITKQAAHEREEKSPSERRRPLISESR